MVEPLGTDVTDSVSVDDPAGLAACPALAACPVVAACTVVAACAVLAVPRQSAATSSATADSLIQTWLRVLVSSLTPLEGGGGPPTLSRRFDDRRENSS